MKLCEEFHTLQGEGRYVGVPSYFIRTTGCNLRCSWKNADNTITICDTPYSSFNVEKGYELDLDRVLTVLSQIKCKHIVITGGEPTLQKDLYETIDYFLNSGYHVTIETNGTRFIDNAGAFYSISPKLKSSYNQTDDFNRQIHEQNNNFIENIIRFKNVGADYQLKFVYNEKDDMPEILDIVKRTHTPYNHVYLMPQGITIKQFQDRAKECFEYCKMYGFNYSPRLHIDVYGNLRGV